MEGNLNYILQAIHQSHKTWKRIPKDPCPQQITGPPPEEWSSDIASYFCPTPYSQPSLPSILHNKISLYYDFYAAFLIEEVISVTLYARGLLPKTGSCVSYCFLSWIKTSGNRIVGIIVNAKNFFIILNYKYFTVALYPKIYKDFSKYYYM